MSQTRTILHGFWGSSCTWRARAALRVKRVPFQELDVDIVKARTQLTEEYMSVNPMQKVPALEIDGVTIVESMAILQYLDETRPSPSLHPNQPIDRMRMREICEVIVSGIQPLQNIGLRPHFTSLEAYLAFCKHWSARGMHSLETLLGRSSSGRFCVGDQLSMADLCLVPQIYNYVNRFKMSISDYPTVLKLYNSLLDEDALKSTSPAAIRPRKQADDVIKN